MTCANVVSEFRYHVFLNRTSWTLALLETQSRWPPTPFTIFSINVLRKINRDSISGSKRNDLLICNRIYRSNRLAMTPCTTLAERQVFAKALGARAPIHATHTTGTSGHFEFDVASAGVVGRSSEDHDLSFTDLTFVGLVHRPLRHLIDLAFLNTNLSRKILNRIGICN